MRRVEGMAHHQPLGAGRHVGLQERCANAGRRRCNHDFGRQMFIQPTKDVLLEIEFFREILLNKICAG